MRGRRLILTSVVCVLAVFGASCARTPPRSALTSKLQQVNGLTKTQATCVTNGLYDGIPTADPAVRRLTSKELRAVAKADNAGKVHPETVQVMRDVVAACVPPAATQGITP